MQMINSRLKSKQPKKAKKKKNTKEDEE
jgi:hypothetical protein